MLTSDNELLESYLNCRDEDAFEQLIRRHSPMVWGVCRSLLWQTQDAEDAYQAIFILLATNAGKLQKHISVGGWLHETAVRTCLKIRRQITRVREVKMEYDPVHCNAEPWQIITSARDLELLHKEIMRLPERNREVIVLCHLEGKSRAQAAETIQCTINVVKAALAHGRKLLRRRLIRHGIAMSAVLSVGGVAGTAKGATAAASSRLLDPLIESTLQACLSPSQVASHSMSSGIQSLVQDKLSSCSTCSFQTGLVVAATAIVVGSLLSVLNWQAPQVAAKTIAISAVPDPQLVTLKPVSLEATFQVPPPVRRPQGQDDDEDFRVSQLTALDHELALLQNTIGLDAEIIAQIKLAIKDQLDKAVARHLKRFEVRMVYFYHPALEEEFEKAVWRQAKKIVPESKMEAFEQFVASAQKLNELQNENAQESVAQFLTNLLSLSTEQKRKVKIMLGKSWISEWNVPARIATHNSAEYAVDIFKTLTMAPVLNVEQLEVFNDIRRFGNISSFSIGSNPDDPAWDFEEIRKRCRVLVDLRIAELDRLCVLSPDQQKRLAIAKKGAIAGVISQWRTTFERLYGDGDENSILDRDTRLAIADSLASICLTNQCVSQPVWTKSIENVLDPTQLEKWKAADRIRTQSNRAVMINKMISSVTAQVSLSYEQHLNMFKMLEQIVDTAGIGGSAEAVQYFAAIPDEEFAKVVEEFQVASILNSVRAQRRRADLKSKMRTDDNDN